jgi:hypothetical protein
MQTFGSVRPCFARVRDGVTVAQLELAALDGGSAPRMQTFGQRPAERYARASSRWWELNPTTPVWRTGVSPQHFTCLAVPFQRPIFWSTVGVWRTRPVLPAWVGWESNPRYGGVRVRYKSQRLLPTRIEHIVVPPPRSRTGISRVSAERTDHCAKGRCRAARDRSSHPDRSRAAPFHQVPCQAPHHHRSSVVREHRDAQGAPRASARSHSLRAHSLRTRDLDTESRSVVRKTGLY